MIITGFARPEETLGRVSKYSPRIQANTLGRTGLSVSHIGFGSYRVTQLDSDHREALLAAIRSGINLIDTSTNYMDGSSERLIGEVLTELINAREIDREEMVIVSKVGYVQGENLKEAKERKKLGQAFPEMVEVDKDLWHNISPAYLEDQITKSLQRLSLETLDVLLLHNPEYFLKSVPNRAQYDDRLKRAFEYLETEVERKRIRWYGISSNTFVESETHRDFTSLDRAFEMASQAKKQNHFAVIQFPLNLFEAGAATISNNNGKTLLARAQEYKLGTLTNRPFNAFHRGRMMRLTSFPVHDQVDVKGRMHSVLGKVIELERRLPDERLRQNFRWGQALRERLSDLSDLLQWREALRVQILPQVNQSLSRLAESELRWGEEYRSSLHELLTLITGTLEGLANERATILLSQMQAVAPSIAEPDTLSRKVLQVYKSIPGVDCVLAGLRQVSYVEDVLRAQIKPIPEAEAMTILRELPKLP